MTNKKLKQKNVAMNMLVTAVVQKNHEILSRFMVAMNDHGFSARRIEGMIDGYTEDVIPGYHELADSDLQNVMVRRELELRKITLEELTAWVRPFASQFIPSLIETIAENLGIFIIYLNQQYGYGRLRVMRLLETARRYDGKWAVAETEKRFGLRIIDADHLQNYESVVKKRVQKVSNEEAERFRREMEACRIITERAG